MKVLPVKLSTRTKLPCSLARIQTLRYKRQSNLLYVFLPFNTMRNIWGFLLLLVGQRKLVLLKLKREYEQKCKGGRRSFSHKLERRS